MEIRKSSLLVFVFLLFSLDSLVKIPLAGVQMHVGLWVFVFMGMYFSVVCRSSFCSFFKSNIAFMFYVILSIFSIFFAYSSGVFFKVFSYIVFFVFFSMAVWQLQGGVDAGRLFFALTVLLIAGGWGQFTLYKIFGFQVSLSGLDASYYQLGGSIEGRMRGLFLEPNWFGLFLYLSFCCCLTFSNLTPRVARLLTFVVGLALFFSGNRIILLLYAVFLIVYWGRGIFSKRLLFSSLVSIFVVLFGLVLTAYFDSDLAAVDRSFSARSVSFQRVLEHFSGSSILNYIFGFGFSSWGWSSNEFGLGVLNFMRDQSLTSRDTAELHVILFEQGMLGVFILAVDSFVYVFRCWRLSHTNRELIGFSVVVMSVPLIALVYPLFTFMPYLLPYIYIRSVLGRRSCI